MGETSSGSGMVPDRELVGAARAGDRQALVAICDRWAERLYNHCFYLRLRREDEARDLTQQTLAIAVRTLGQLREPERFAGWLFAIAHHEAGRMAPARAAWAATPGPDADDDVDGEVEAAADAEAARLAGTPAGMVMDAELRREVWRLVWQAAAGLAQVDRELLSLSHREGFRPSELGLISGLEPSVVRQRLARVQEQLERTLGALLVARLAGQGGGDEGGHPLGQPLGAPCAQLAALLGGWDGRFTGTIRQGVSRHVDRCETCTARRRLLVTPDALLPPPVPVPWHLRDRILSRLQLAATGIPFPSRPARLPAGPPRHDRRAARAWSALPAEQPAAGPAASIPPVAATRVAAARPPRPRPPGPTRPLRLLSWLRGHAKVLVLAVLLVLFVWLGGWLALRGQPSPFTPGGGPGSHPPGGRTDARAGTRSGSGSGPSPLAAPTTTTASRSQESDGSGGSGAGSGGGAQAAPPGAGAGAGVDAAGAPSSSQGSGAGATSGPQATQAGNSTTGSGGGGGGPGSTAATWPAPSTTPVPTSTRGQPATTQATPLSTVAAGATTLAPATTLAAPSTTASTTTSISTGATTTTIATATTMAASTTTATTSTAAPVLAVTVTGTGGVTASDAAGNPLGGCVNDSDDSTTFCTWVEGSGSTLTVEAWPAPGQTPAWSGACAGTVADTCVLTLDGDLDVAVAFSDASA